MPEYAHPEPFAHLTPERLLRDIAYYRQKALALQDATKPQEQGMRAVYQALASDRQRLLAALQDGQPEAWTDYTG
jgi:hypothetical protein